MKWSSLHSVGRTIVHLAIVLLFVSGISFAAVSTPNAKTDFTFQQISGVAVPRPIGDQSVGEAIFSTRGVMLQGQAEFRFGKQQIDPKQITLSWVNDSEKRGFLRLSYKNSPLDVSWPEEEILRVAYWVAASKSTIAFSLLPENDEKFSKNRDQLVAQGYVKTTFPMKIPEVSRYYSNSILVHEALNSPFLVNILGYIDFADSTQDRPRTSDVVRLHGDAATLVSSLNELGGYVAQPEQPTIDFSYTNTDYKVQFKADFLPPSLSGAPIRLYWSRYEGQSKPFYRGAYRFISEEDMSEAVRLEFGEQQKRSIELYRLASIFRAFQMKNPEELIEFVNQGVSRRNSTKK